MAAARGLSWRRHETLDLLAIWGERRIQVALRQSHRNIDLYEEIASEMRSRGHNRTAQECRNKTKSLRLEYKKVVGLNGKSGQDRKTCPFYEEIDAILHGDADVWPKRVTQSSDAPEPRSSEESNAPAPTETTETLLLFTGPTADETVQVEPTDGADVVYLVSDVVDGSLEDSDPTQIEVLLQEEPRSEAAGDHTAEGQVAVMDKGSAGDEPRSEAAVVHTAERHVAVLDKGGAGDGPTPSTSGRKATKKPNNTSTGKSRSPERDPDLHNRPRGAEEQPGPPVQEEEQDPEGDPEGASSPAGTQEEAVQPAAEAAASSPGGTQGEPASSPSPAAAAAAVAAAEEEAGPSRVAPVAEPEPVVPAETWLGDIRRIEALCRSTFSALTRRMDAFDRRLRRLERRVQGGGAVK
ncbi:zinc finger and SCAN domain-containing protein 29-like [Heteronotia binoei]|uniref:zinc finger and SCAN domain-containing protein 29-like n=1 Tax=Heteronotia binoei TaxID=13085 RepID=UPI0029302EEA|nr:zinc finger and SCAN domain-containing protein 29-like [Heteronotia binoei]